MVSNAILTLSIDGSLGTPRYLQLLEQLKKLITSKALKAQDKLPSSRELAGLLGVSRSTSVKCYDILISEGYLLSKPKRGVFVSDLIPCDICPVNSFDVTADKASKSVNTRLQDRVMTRLDSGVDVSAFPNKAWAASMRRSWLNPDAGVMRGLYSDGLPQLKQYLASYLASLRGLECDAEQIIITAGNRDALSILTHALIAQDTQKNHQVWLENPCFMAMSQFFHWLGSPLKPLAIDSDGAQLPSFINAEKTTQLALITPNRQYPLGLAMSSMRRQMWLTLLATMNRNIGKSDEKQGLWLIEDDYDNEFIYQGRMGVPLMNLDTSQSTFLVGSFSKVMFRGLRLGFIVAPKRQAQNIIMSQQKLGSSASLPMQSALLDFMETGAFSSHLRRMRRHYLEKRDFLESCLNNGLEQYCEWQKASSGMNTAIHIKDNWLQEYKSIQRGDGLKSDLLLDEYIAEELAKNAIVLSLLSQHYFDKTDLKQGFVIGFSEPDKTSIEKVIKSLLVVFMQIFDKK